MRVLQRAEAARTCTPLGLAHRLAKWVGDGRPVTAGGVLTVRDAAEAIQALGLRPPGDVPELDLRQETLFNGGLHGGPSETRDLARRSAGLAGAWNIALDVRFIEVVDGHVRPGAALGRWPGGTDDDVVAVWREALTSVLSLRLEHGDDTPDDLASVLTLILEILYDADGGGLSLLELRDQLVACSGRRAFGGDDYWDRVRRCGVVLGHAVARLAQVGAVTVERDVVRLTPLGSWAWGEEIIRRGRTGSPHPRGRRVEPLRWR